MWLHIFDRHTCENLTPMIPKKCRFLKSLPWPTLFKWSRRAVLADKSRFRWPTGSRPRAGGGTKLRLDFFALCGVAGRRRGGSRRPVGVAMAHRQDKVGNARRDFGAET